MKKITLPLFLVTATSAFAVAIGPDTQIKWNAIVVVAAAESVGLTSGSGVHDDVEMVYFGVMNDLLEREKFSVSEAVSVCMQQCNKSDFLINGRGESGRKCPAICSEFGRSLVAENNKKTEYLLVGEGSYNAFGKIYDENKRFYALDTKTNYLSETKDECSYAIFETATDEIIAKCSDVSVFDRTEEMRFNVIDEKYGAHSFELHCGGIACSLYVEIDKEEQEWIDKADIRGQKAKAKTYSYDKKFYSVSTGANYKDVAVFEASTNKKIAVFEDIFGEDCYSETKFKIVDDRFKDYEFTEGCGGCCNPEGCDCELEYENKRTTAQREAEENGKKYTNLYSKVASCVNDLRDLQSRTSNLVDVKNLASSDLLSENVKKALKELYENSDFYSKFNELPKYSASSRDLTSLEIYKNTYCVNTGVYDKASSAIKKLKIAFSGSFAKRFADKRAKDLKTAKTFISEAIRKNLDDDEYRALDLLHKLNCTGECNHFPGTQDYVACTFGNLKAVFEFDTICSDSFTSDSPFK